MADSTFEGRMPARRGGSSPPRAPLFTYGKRTSLVTVDLGLRTYQVVIGKGFCGKRTSYPKSWIHGHAVIITDQVVSQLYSNRCLLLSRRPACSCSARDRSQWREFQIFFRCGETMRSLGLESG